MRRRVAALLVGALALLLPSGCGGSHVLQEAEHQVPIEAAQRTWRPARAEDLEGFFASTAIEGQAAGAVLKAYYLFDRGHYSSAALVVGAQGPRFTVLQEEGRFAFDPRAGLEFDSSGSRLELAASDPAHERDALHLRLDSGESKITFRRQELR